MRHEFLDVTRSPSAAAYASQLDALVAELCPGAEEAAADVFPPYTVHASPLKPQDVTQAV